MQELFTIRNILKEEMYILINYAQNEGWNPGLEDEIAFFEADKNGFFAGYINDKPIAFISAVKYLNKYGFIGLYIVDPLYRGKGYGYQIWQHALKYLGNISIGLDGVVAQIENYKKSGFKLAFMQNRWSSKRIKTPRPQSVQQYRDSDFESLIQYDKSIFGFERVEFLKSWLKMSSAKAFVVSNKNNILGWALIRKCHDGYKIGPLFADNDEVAHDLFLACHNSADEDETIYIDMPETQINAHNYIKQYGLKCQFQTARMYKNGSISWDEKRIYGITTFELG